MAGYSRAVSALFVIFILAFSAPSFAAASLGELTAELDRAQEPVEFARTAARLELLVTDARDGAGPALVQLGRAYYLLGESETDEDRRLGYLDRAVAASEKALKLLPENPYALYWRSMAFLQKADIEGGLSALRMVKRALADFEKVEAKAPDYDGAGAYRSHGKVLMEAPAWAFIGDKDRGVELLEKAKNLAPRSLLNRLYLAEAYSGTDRKDDAVRELEYIANAPVGEVKPKDDLNTKEDAAALLDKLRR